MALKWWTRRAQVPSFKEVDEEYTEVKYRTVKRDKEVWVKKIVQEDVRHTCGGCGGGFSARS